VGTLQIEREKVGKSILFQDGRRRLFVRGFRSGVASSSSTRKITEDQLRQALVLQEQHRRHRNDARRDGCPAARGAVRTPRQAEETIFSRSTG
jgi:hypothetical protein